MKKYLIVEDETVHGFQVYSQHDTLEDAETKRVNDERIVSIEIVSQEVSDYSSDPENEYAIVSVSALINDSESEANFAVQLSDGAYESQNDCWITTTGGDYEFSDDEMMIFEVADIIALAEEAANSYKLNNFEDLSGEFNCSINSVDLVVRVNKNDGTAQIVLIDNSHNSVCDYDRAEEFKESFDSKEEAFEFLEQFRTGEYQDCRGLYAYLNKENLK